MDIFAPFRRRPADPGALAPSQGRRTEQLVELRLKKTESRRDFLRNALGAGTAAAAASCSTPSFEEYFQQHYTELTDEDKERIFSKIERKVRDRSGVEVRVGDPPPLEGVEFAFALDLNLCNGNRRCVEACARENNLPDDPEIRYIRVLELEQGTLDLEKGNVDYDPEKVPRKNKYYLPVQCQQCANPPCVTACPVGATWAEPDGIVVIDYDWCIGCRFCEVACPYFARRFNFVEPSVRPDRINPDQGYLSNRPRKKGVVEKCTYCLHRTRRGRYPACLEACPTGARKFGNMNDPNSEVRRIIDTQRVYVLKEELGTLPRFYYYFS